MLPPPNDRRAAGLTRSPLYGCGARAQTGYGSGDAVIYWMLQFLRDMMVHKDGEGTDALPRHVRTIFAMVGICAIPFFAYEGSNFLDKINAMATEITTMHVAIIGIQSSINHIADEASNDERRLDVVEKTNSDQNAIQFDQARSLSRIEAWVEAQRDGKR